MQTTAYDEPVHVDAGHWVVSVPEGALLNDDDPRVIGRIDGRPALLDLGVQDGHPAPVAFAVRGPVARSPQIAPILLPPGMMVQGAIVSDGCSSLGPALMH